MIEKMEDKKRRELVEKQMRDSLEQQVKEVDAKLSKTHTRKEYTYTANEADQKRMIEIIHIHANQLSDNLLNTVVLPRVGVTPSKDVQVLESVLLGRFVCWVPKEDKLSNKKIDGKDS